MHSKAKIETEQFYWNKQIERHRIGKKMRNIARKIKDRPYKNLASKLKINRRTVWAIANGLTITSKELIEKIERLEK